MGHHNRIEQCCSAPHTQRAGRPHWWCRQMPKRSILQQTQVSKKARKGPKPAKQPSLGHASQPSRRLWLTAASAVDQQAADIVRKLLAAHENGTKGRSVKYLCLAPEVQAKTAVYAVVCKTLQNLKALEAVRQATGLADNSELERSTALVLLYELLLGEGMRRQGAAEHLVVGCNAPARQAFAAQPAAQQSAADRHARCVRVNALKMTHQQGMDLLSKWAGYTPKELQDPLLPDVALLPADCNLHDHPAVLDGRLVLQVQPCKCWPALAGAHCSRCSQFAHAEPCVLPASARACSTAGVDRSGCVCSPRQQDQPPSRWDLHAARSAHTPCRLARMTAQVATFRGSSLQGLSLVTIAYNHLSGLSRQSDRACLTSQAKQQFRLQTLSVCSTHGQPRDHTSIR